MKKRLTMFFAGLFLCVGMVLAQTKVTGVVVNSVDGEPVIGASVKIVGSQQGIITDADGKFVLTNVRGGQKLEISYIGMQTVTVKAAANMRVALEPDNKVLSEVMVVAYGTQKKSTFTGSAAIVGSDEIGKVQVNNPIDAMKGKAAGVQINTLSGQPGSTPTIRIRGYNSINAKNDPLIVLDGSPFDGDINTINTVDIESMTVLKDAASTALYGARGGNGVILITTKSAKKNQGARITVDAKWGSNSKAVPEYETIKNPAAYYEMWYKGLYNFSKTEWSYDDNAAWQFANANLINNTTYGLGYNVFTVPEGQQLIGTNGKINPNATLGALSHMGSNTYWLTPDDWDDEIYNSSLRQEYTVSISGGSDKGSFYGSANYMSNDGIAAGSDFSRFTTRLKTDYQAKPWLKVSANMSYAHYDRNQLGNDGSGGSIGNSFAYTNIAPIYPMYMRDANGNKMIHEESGIWAYDYGNGTVAPFRAYISGGNPISDALVNTANTQGNTFNATGTAEISLPLGFSFTSINSVYLDEYRGTTTVNPWFGQYAAQNGQVRKSHGRVWSYNYQQRLNWRKQFGKHDIEAMAGHEYYRQYISSLTGTKSNQFSVNNKELSGAVVLVSAGSGLEEYNTESWLGRVQYDYDTRYFASLSATRQASSRFAEGNWWGTFWSFGGGWLINREAWFNAPWVDELKLKASYGENGNDNLNDNYYWIRYYEIVNSSDQVALTPSSMGNPNISWEKNAKFNVGVDFSFLNKRFWGSVEYYRNTTKDMLSYVPMPPSYGWDGYYDNVGNMLNSGVEVDLHADIISNKELVWNVYANITSNHNEITKLAAERKKNWKDGFGLGYSSAGYFYQEGQSRFTMYGKKYAGVDEETGKALYWKHVYASDPTTGKLLLFDVNGNEVDENYLGNVHHKVVGHEKTADYSEASDYSWGDVLPDFYGGFGTSVSWKGIDFSVDFQYQIGGLVNDGTYGSLMGWQAGTAMHVDLLNAWSEDNTRTNIPRLNYGDKLYMNSSDRFLTNASYLSLSNITLGYTLPANWMSYVGLQSVRLYVVADNVWVWSKRQGLDPRQSITGSFSNSYHSPVRTVSGGVTVTF